MKKQLEKGMTVVFKGYYDNMNSHLQKAMWFCLLLEIAQCIFCVFVAVCMYCDSFLFLS